MGSITSILKEALLFIYPIGHIGLAVAAWFTLSWSVQLWKNAMGIQLSDTTPTNTLPPDKTGLAPLVLPVLLASISYDNFVLGAGRFIGEGDVLEKLSMLRFLLHYIIVPFFIVVGVEIAYEAGAKWANQGIRILSWILAAGLAISDVSRNYFGLKLTAYDVLGVLRYTAETAVPPFVTIAVNIFMLLIAIGIWVRLKWSWLFVGTLIAFIGNAIPTSIVGTFPSCLSELLMALSLLLTEKRIQDLKNPPKPSTLETIQDFDWEYELPQDGYTIYQAGSHSNGDFIQVYVPHNPYRTTDGNLKLITYLHGFALCLPKFYKTHLAYLAGQKGYYVFFPDFQTSDYPDNPEEANVSIAEQQDSAPLISWFKVLQQTLSNPTELSIGEILAKIRARRRKAPRIIVSRLFRPTLLKYLRVSISLMVIISVVRLVYFFINRKYGQNLIQLISTVGWSLLHSPKEWVNQAIGLTDIAWQKLGQKNSDLTQAEFDFYVFGHSLGGLLALSWPFFINADQQRFKPIQILTADPAPSTEMGIPSFVMLILKLFNVPFAEDPVTIAETGASLTNIPVGIMHGASDKIVKPQAWVKPALFAKEANYDYIPKGNKQIYFSQSNREKNLVAFHNQAVTDTTYFENALFMKFGGVKEDPNAYNYNYVWPGLDLVVQNEKQASDLLKSFQNPYFQVLDTFTTGAPLVQRLGVAIATISIASLVCWLFSTGTLFT